jgi:hypothetical protein
MWAFLWRETRYGIRIRTLITALVDSLQAKQKFSPIFSLPVDLEV